ncbi:FeoA family protein [Clostridium cylindrosporum]|uniref:Fe2+ transport system protein A n=1 Tax=Clostridium cylindrosporum DSM 605 TaxID=1121307 RepID=A0A0J8D5N1_CLOCY|nr:FeoA family protein [Clostridium cylindrosporum]KMT21147.1 Fe2+ transport system protein A [Clostridium cylindrosporum DSM 605]
MRNLHNAVIGEKVIVNSLFAENELKERLLALGVTKGAKLEVLRKGPQDNLTVFRIRGAMIALRKEESSLIYIH